MWSCSLSRVLVGFKVPWKALAPKELFKIDFIAQHKAANLSTNPCTAEFWQAFRTAWSQVEPQRMQHYERESESSKDLTKQARQPAPPVSQELVPVQGGSSAAVGQRGGDRLARQHALTAGTILVGLQEPPEHEPENAVAVPVLPTPESTQPEYPVASEALMPFIQKSKVSAMATAFQKCSKVLQLPTPDDFPPVHYPKQCQGLCTSTTPPIPLRMQGALLKALTDTCSGFAVSSDIFIACEVKEEDLGEPSVVCFALLASALGSQRLMGDGGGGS